MCCCVILVILFFSTLYFLYIPNLSTGGSSESDHTHLKHVVNQHKKRPFQIFGHVSWYYGIRFLTQTLNASGFTASCFGRSPSSCRTHPFRRVRYASCDLEGVIVRRWWFSPPYFHHFHHILEFEKTPNIFGVLCPHIVRRTLSLPRVLHLSLRRQF